MRNKLRRFMVVLCILTMALGLTACGKQEAVDVDVAKYTQMAQAYTANLITAIPYDEIELALQEQEPADIAAALEYSGIKVDGDGFIAAVASWEKSKAELGDLASVEGITVNADKEEVTALVDIVGTTGKTAQMEYIFNSKGKMTSCVTNVNKSFGELMTNAALNTLLGMGTVFVVLIFISFIISLFKYVNEFEKKMKEKKSPKESPAAAAADKAVAQIIETEELADDLELVAVISAAIAAYEEAAGGSGDGYVVRSIKRRA